MDNHEYNYIGFTENQLENIQTFYIAKLNYELPEHVEDDDRDTMYKNLGAVTLRLANLPPDNIICLWTVKLVK